MIYNFNRMFLDNGFVMKVDKDGYQKCYREDEKDHVAVYDGELYILSNYGPNKEAEYKLIEINGSNLKGYDLLIIEKGIIGEKSCNVIRDFIRNNS